MTATKTGWHDFMNYFLVRSRNEDVYFYKKDRELIERMKLEEEALRLKIRHLIQCSQCGHNMDSLTHEHLALHHCRHCASIHIPMEALALMEEDNPEESSIRL
jgi:hypothetical protein